MDEAIAFRCKGCPKGWTKRMASSSNGSRGLQPRISAKAAKPLHLCVAGAPRDGEAIFGPRRPLRSYAAAPLCHRSGLESPGSCCATTKSHQYDKTANE